MEHYNNIPTLLVVLLLTSITIFYSYKWIFTQNKSKKVTQMNEAKPILISSQTIKASKYELKASTTIRGPPNQIFHMWNSLSVQSVWLFKEDIDIKKLKKALEITLNAFPWVSSKITEIKNNSYVLSHVNQGIKFETMCLPNYSLSDINKLDRLFEGECLHCAELNGFLFGAQIIYLNRSTIAVDKTVTNVVNGGCILTLRSTHLFADGQTVKLLSQYLSNVLSNHKYENINQNKQFELFSWDTKDYENIYHIKHSTVMERIVSYINIFKLMRSSSLPTLYQFEFSNDQLKEMKNKFIDIINHRFNGNSNVKFLRSYEIISSLFAEKMAKYSKEMISKTDHIIGLRNIVENIHENHISGVLMTGVAVAHHKNGCDKYSIAFDIHNKINSMHQNGEMVYEAWYNNIVTSPSELRYCFNTLRPFKFNNMKFGTKYGSLYNYQFRFPFHVMADQNNDSIRVWMNLEESVANQLKENEPEFWETHHVSKHLSHLSNL
eukprot:431447_1